ncbi:MAG: glycogen synthase GlgA [Rhodospirillales bacterium]|nr:glycogen synthase GlgA [Rhodospirillales bacterium]
MAERLKIAFLASESVPFIKSGGLADVAGALPKALAERGHDVVVIVPCYATIRRDLGSFEPFISPLGVWMGDSEEWCTTFRAEVGDVRYYFIESNKYFDRYGLYHDAEFDDYRDNARRFGFFTRAALQLCKDSGFAADIVHAHDWQTALSPAYLKVWHWDDPVLGGAASVLTIHNIAHQGKYDRADYGHLGLQWGNFTNDKFEDFGGINMLKGGIHFADMVTTVSPTYAEETRGDVGGNGLGPYLRQKGDHYWGILNGADYDHWDPAIDEMIAARYRPSDRVGKQACKRELQRLLNLEEADDIPIVGVIGRFVAQKGFDLLAQSIHSIVESMRVQFAILGSGEKELEWTFGPLPARYPSRVGSYIGYNEELAHQIEAGADFLLMPSRYEPCGLNQLYSLKYGTLPIVRATGGLNDTVHQYDEATGSGTGFKFFLPTAQAVFDTVGWAVSTYFDRPLHMDAMIREAMAEDFSWKRSAISYEHAYAKAIATKQASP